MKLSRSWSRVLLALAIIVTVAVGLVGTGGRASGAASRAGHAEWNYAHGEGPWGFSAFTCEVDWCFPTPYTMNGYMAWDMSLEGRLAVVTNADISSDVPNGICCGPFSMDVTTKHYVWDGSGTYQGSMAPDTQPNGRQDCTGGQDDALSCVNRYWGWVLSWEAGRIEFDHNSFVVTHDDQNNMYGWDVYYYWP